MTTILKRQNKRLIPLNSWNIFSCRVSPYEMFQNARLPRPPRTVHSHPINRPPRWDQSWHLNPMEARMPWIRSWLVTTRMTFRWYILRGRESCIKPLQICHWYWGIDPNDWNEFPFLFIVRGDFCLLPVSNVSLFVFWGGVNEYTKYIHWGVMFSGSMMFVFWGVNKYILIRTVE